MHITQNRYRAVIVIASAIAGITIGIFSQVRNFDFLVYDDHTYVTSNPQVKGGLNVKNVVWAFTTIQASNWHPLTWLSLMLDCQLFGPDPGWFHLTNLLLHTASTVLLFVVLVKMTGALWPGAFVAVAFALHPLHIQSVAWIAERKDVLSSLFWMLTMVFYAQYAASPSTARYVITLVSFVFGLLAKPMLVTLPFVLLVLDYWPLGRLFNSKFQIRKLLVEKVPFFLLSVVSSVITLVAQIRSGAVKDIIVFPLAVRIANALVSYVTYIAKMFWPTKLSIFYPHPGNTYRLSTVLLCVLLLVVITVSLIMLSRTRRYPLAGWLWFIGTLFPVIGLVQVGNQAMADRYTYIPLIGLFIIIAWGISDLSAKFSLAKPIFAVAAGVAVLAMSVSTYLQLRYWQNSISILEHAIEVTNGNRFAHANLGAAFLQENKFDEAIVHFDKALQIDPCDFTSHLNLGVALFRKGTIDPAVNQFEKALQIDPCNIATHLNLGVALTRQGKVTEAIEHYNEALRIDPCCTDANDLRQKLLLRQQRQK